jgi:osmotically-inducible protein OsmY
MNKQQHFVLGVFAGAMAMYLLDPDRGRRRRALLRDQVVHGAHELEELGDTLGSRARDLRNRARGTVIEARARIREHEVEDHILEARVRSELGHMVSETGAIEVTSGGGVVTLTGEIPSEEIARVVAQVGAVRGVRDVVNRMTVSGEQGQTGDSGGNHVPMM